MGKREAANILKVAGVYTASVIGAGFASGQELVRFFLKHGKLSFAGIILAGLLFSVLGYIVLDRVFTQRIRNYEEFIIPMVGMFAGRVIDIASTLFTMSVFCIMIAGSGSIIAELLKIPLHWGVSIAALTCMFVLIADIKGVVGLATVITPILILGMLAVSIFLLVNKDIQVFNTEKIIQGITGNWVLSAMIYVSYNSIMSVVVLCSLLPYLKTRRTGRLGGILGGIALGISALLISLALFFFHPEKTGADFPLLEVIRPYSAALSAVYTGILFLAMLLSAITAGFCVTEKVSRRLHIRSRLAAPVICALAVPLSAIGFSKLIGTVYPIFGCIGLFMLIVILLYGLKDLIHGIRERRCKRLLRKS